MSVRLTNLSLDRYLPGNPIEVNIRFEMPDTSHMDSWESFKGLERAIAAYIEERGQSYWRRLWNALRGN